MSIYDLFRRKYNLAQESEDAGFRGNVPHFRSYLAYCPRHAIGSYGRSKYDMLRKQLGLPVDVEPRTASAS